MNRFVSVVLAGWLGLMSQLALAASPDEIIGMVLDLQGKGEILRKGEGDKLQLLNYVKSGTRLKLGAQSKVSVSHYGARLVYQLAGPALAEIDLDKIRIIEGAAPVTKSMAEKLVVAATKPDLWPAGITMRNVKKIAILTPMQNIALFTTRPHFKWEASEAGSYQVTLDEQPDHPILHTRVDTASWELPADMRLEYGKNYRFTVSFTSSFDEKLHSTSTHFSIGSKADADSLLALKPAADAAIEEWVLYASVLQSRQMFDEMREVWCFIEAQRPDLVKAQKMAH